MGKIHSLFARDSNGLAPSLDVVRNTLDVLGHHLSYIPFDQPGKFALGLKIGPAGTIAMNEMLAIYAVMFFLGSTVRYRPEVLEGMLAKKDAWLIESFLRTAPITFLRHARNFLDGRYITYRER